MSMTIGNEQEKQSAVKRLAELSKQVEGNSPEIRDLQEQVDLLDMEIKEKQKKIASLREEMKNLKTQAMGDLKAAKKEIAELRNAISDYLLNQEVAKVA